MPGLKDIAIVLPAARQLLKATELKLTSVVDVNDLPLKKAQSPIIFVLSMTVLAATFT
jgi:hypothetical protein